MVSPNDAYHAGMRGLQDRFDTRRLADRLVDKLSRTEVHRRGSRVRRESNVVLRCNRRLRRAARLLVQRRCSGVRPSDRRQRDRVSSYDGNGMFRSLGNVLVNPAIALLFIDFEQPRRVCA